MIFVRLRHDSWRSALFLRSVQPWPKKMTHRATSPTWNSDMSPYLSLILPAYNEVRSIVRTLTEVRAYLGRQTYSHEILVCADGDDGTREAAREFFAGSPQGRVLGSPQRRGKGAGVREGVLAADGQIIGFM